MSMKTNSYLSPIYSSIFFFINYNAYCPSFASSILIIKGDNYSNYFKPYILKGPSSTIKTLHIFLIDGNIISYTSASILLREQII